MSVQYLHKATTSLRACARLDPPDFDAIGAGLEVTVRVGVYDRHGAGSSAPRSPPGVTAPSLVTVTARSAGHGRACTSHPVGATGGVGKAAIQGVLRHPELELVGCWVHSDDKKTAAMSANSSARSRSGGLRAPTSTSCSRWTPTASCTPRCCPTAGRQQDPALRQEPGDPGRLGVPRPREPRGARHRGGRPGGRCHPARLGHPSRRHHRALPADGLVALLGDHPRPRRGVLRHPHLQRPAGGARGDGLRVDPRTGDERTDRRPAGGRLQGLGTDGHRPTGFPAEPGSGPPRRSRWPSPAPTNSSCRWSPAPSPR